MEITAENRQGFVNVIELESILSEMEIHIIDRFNQMQEQIDKVKQDNTILRLQLDKKIKQQKMLKIR